MNFRLKKTGSKIQLSKQNFLAQGGEGSVYVKGGTAYKIYTDPSKVIPAGKIDELSTISRSEVIKPEDLILDRHGQPVGYAMRFIKNGKALCRTLTPAYKRRHNIQSTTIGKLVSGMRDVLQNIHNSNVLVVDLNEFNLLVDQKMGSVLWIDVDSWQTPGFPATAIMESVRDHRSSGFSKTTDWFSFAIVTFQLWTGIHPYKGKHPDIKDLKVRMSQSISVFNKDVSVPKICPSFDIIPHTYRVWYHNVLECGERIPPPGVVGTSVVIAPIIRTVVSSEGLSITEVLSSEYDILHFDEVVGNRIVFTADGVQVGRMFRKGIKPNARIGKGPGGRIIHGWVDKGKLSLKDLVSNSPIEIDLAADDAMSIGDRIYSKHGEDLCEIEMMEMPNGKIRASARKVASVMLEATKLCDGLVIQDMLGSYYASFFPVSGKSHQLRLKELDGWKLIDAKHDRRVLMVVGAKGGKYRKWIIILFPDWSGYVVRETKDISYSGLNFTVLDNGVCAHLNEDEKLELFSNDPRSNQSKLVDNDQLDSGMSLFRCGGSVAFLRGKNLYKLSTK